MTKRKHGETRADGYRFWSYEGGKEKWYRTESFEARSRKKREKIAAFRSENPEADAQRREAYRLKQAEIQRAYHRANPDQRAKHHIVRSGRMKNEGSRTAMAVVYAMRDRLTACTGIRWHVDHITPLAKGGAHHESNLRVITWRANLRKGCR